jgi:hypothetical protein
MPPLFRFPSKKGRETDGLLSPLSVPRFNRHFDLVATVTSTANALAIAAGLPALVPVMEQA